VKELRFDTEGFPKHWHLHFNSTLNNLDKFEERSYFSPADYVGKHVLDFGGSGGQLAVALLAKGAASATLVDPEISEEIFTQLCKISNLKIVRGYAEEMLAENKNEFDFIVAHSVTEHVRDLVAVFSVLKELIKPGGKFFIAHDNYFHASGHHDNIILQIGDDGRYGYQGPKCWETGLCQDSSAFRRSMMDSLPFIWSIENELTLKDGNCLNCNFKKRCSPWAHILYQDEFNQVFKEPVFSTGRENSVLNKITPFQLRQFLVEAGFKIDLWERSLINNPVPEELMRAPHFLSKEDLQTENVFVIASKQL
jgi:SAM-dependent methyltransferase